MQLKANKGEWSEFYAFLKILSDKVLHSADKTLTLIPGSFLKILSVIRYEDAKNIEYEIDELQDSIVIKTDHKILGTIPIFQISDKLAGILKKIKEDAVSKGAFPLPEVQKLMSDLQCKKIKSPSSKKADIFLKIEDQNTGTNPIKGFSIKSKIGGMSTLLNASGATNFEFEIVCSSDKSNHDGNKPLIGLDRMLRKNEELKFIGISNMNFKRNLMMIDSRMPEIVAEMLKAYYFGVGTSLGKLIVYIKKNDPLKIGNHKHFYENNIQELLFAIAFGMQPSKPWKGDYETHGGYIIVKKNGELACYHVYDRDKFRKFLFVNTKFETPSTTRHKFGQIYESEGKRYIKLNLQIRFKN